MARKPESYEQRIARNFRNQQAVGLPTSRQAARGHFEEVPFRHNPDAYRAANLVARYGGSVSTRGDIAINADYGLDKLVRQLANRAPNTKLYITVDGFTIYHKGGISPEALLDIVDDEFNGIMDLAIGRAAFEQDTESPKKKKTRTREQEREHSQKRRQRERQRRQA